LDRLHEGGDYACNIKELFSPSVRGRAAEGGRGLLTHHLELELGTFRRSAAHLALDTSPRPSAVAYTLPPLRG